MILTISREDYLQLRDHLETWEEPMSHLLLMEEYEDGPSRSLEIRCHDCHELVIELIEEIKE